MERNRADHTPESATLPPSDQKASQAIQLVAQASHRKLESLLGVGTTRAVMLLKRSAVHFGNFAKQRKGGILIGVNIAVQKAASI